MQDLIIWADVPDPSVIRVGDIYYMTSTTMHFNPGCPIMKSRDLISWELIGYVYESLGDMDCLNLENGKNDYGKGSWASSLRYHNGRFYVAFMSYSTKKTYIFQTDDIENGQWEKHELDGIYHDMSLLFDDDGRVFMTYGGGAIRVIELTSDATAIKPNGMDKIIIPNADPSGGSNLAEGSHIYKINGYYYIFIIAWPDTGSKRRIQVLYRSEKIDGEYEGKIVFDEDFGFHNNGVAQGGIVNTPDGKWYGLLFQDHGAVGRAPVLLTAEWEDNWIKFTGNVQTPAGIPKIVQSDDFNGEKLALQWQWNHNPDNENWSLSARKGWLRLTTGYVCEGFTTARNTLTQRTFGPRCSGKVLLDTSGMKDGDFAGLAALQEIYGFAGVKMTNSKKYIISADTADEKTLELKQDLVYLKIDFDFENLTDEAKFFYSLDGESWTQIGGILKMQYLLSHFTGYRFALFNFATENIGGYADFDWFKISS